MLVFQTLFINASASGFSFLNKRAVDYIGLPVNSAGLALGQKVRDSQITQWLCTFKTSFLVQSFKDTLNDCENISPSRAGKPAWQWFASYELRGGP